MSARLAMPCFRHQRAADADEFERRIALLQRAREIGAERIAGGFRRDEEDAAAQASPTSARVKP